MVILSDRAVARTLRLTLSGTDGCSASIVAFGAETAMMHAVYECAGGHALRVEALKLLLAACAHQLGSPETGPGARRSP